MTAAEPRIDFTKIAFPTDPLTVKQLRKARPTAFDVDVPESMVPDKTPCRSGVSVSRTNWATQSLGDTINDERELAELAFEVALGTKPSGGVSAANRAELAEWLISDYVELGLATGEHAAEMLLQDIELQAAKQAKSFLGRTP